MTNIDKLFSGCQELLALDLSNLNLKNIENSNNVFTDVKQLSYINAYNVSNLNKANFDAISSLNLIVCQSDMILKSENFKYICYDFNLEQKKCHSNNYITVKYMSDANYQSGFKNGVSSYLGPFERKGINYIIKGKSIFKDDEPLLIDGDKSIEIHFYPNISTLENFFCGESEIISVDLSHFDFF